MTFHIPSKAFWHHSNPEIVASDKPTKVIRNGDIEKMKAYDIHGHYLGQPEVGQYYSKIEKYCGGKLVTIVDGGYIQQSESREPYEYDVYASSISKRQSKKMLIH